MQQTLLCSVVAVLTVRFTVPQGRIWFMNAGYWVVAKRVKQK